MTQTSMIDRLFRRKGWDKKTCQKCEYQIGYYCRYQPERVPAIKQRMKSADPITWRSACRKLKEIK